LASTIKVTNIDTPDNTGNITVDRPLAGSGASLTSLPAANLTGTIAAISGANLTALNATQLTSGTLPIARIADDAVTTAKIADNAITLAKMAGGTDGQIITYDASGNPVAVGPGTDGQVLTSTGAGSPPAFEDAIGGVDGIVSSANATAITIDSDEKVGIGGAPDEKLHITNGYLKFSGGAYGVRHADSFVVQTGGTTEHLRVASTGEVTIPQQPSFLGTLTSRNSSVTGGGAGYSTSGKTFTDVYDVGSNFSNGLFTAPVAGKYILYGTLYFINTASNMNQTIIYVETSNRGYNALRSHGYNIFPYQGNFSFSVVADMDASDTFYINCNMYGGSNNTHVEGGATTRNGTFMGAILVG